jgi:eukaryotic-like serine/threonine-protein kinase
VNGSFNVAVASDSPTDVPQQALGPGRQFGPYELLGRIARGGMAEIYLARDRPAPGAERLLVVKCILPGIAEEERFVRMFEREARIALRLKHPGICPVYELGCHEGRYYLAMEWIEGASLLELLQRTHERRVPLPLPVVLKIAASVAEALDSVHHARNEHGRPLGLIHRDVSPHNVVISWDGMVKLLDFGVAKVRSEATQTQAGMVLGKFGYLAPEQCRGEPLDSRCDVFALGVVLFEALTGRRLYRRQTELDTLKAIVGEPVPSVRVHRPDLPRELDAIMRRALAKHPADRFTSAGHMALALHQFLSQRGTLVTSSHVAHVMREHFAEDIRRRIPELHTDTELLRSLAPVSLAPIALTPDHSGVARLRRVAPEGDRPAAVEARPSQWTFTFQTPAWRDGLAMVARRIAPLKSRALEAMERYPRALMAIGLGAALTIAAAPFGLFGSSGQGAPASEILSKEPTHVATVPTSAANLEPPGATAAAAVADEEPVVEEAEPPMNDGAERDVEAVDPRPRGAAIIHVNTRPWSLVYTDDRFLGATPIAKARVPAGTLWLRFVDRDGTTHRKRVVLSHQEERGLFFDLQSDEHGKP